MKKTVTDVWGISDRLHVVCGPGGVGKTTTSAALALSSAGEGRRTLVCTIDPSRRLRTSLGLKKLSHRPQKVTANLHAMRIDPKATFDDLVREHAASAAARDRILGNRFYQQISRHLVGTHDVMAMEALISVAEDFDRIVLDTPPSSSALAFIDAPGRVLDFVDGRVLKYFLRPYFVAGRLAIEPRTVLGRTLFSALDSAVGLAFLRDLSEFFLAFEGLFDSFGRTATRMQALLRDPGTAFLLVTTPLESRVDESVAFAEALIERQLRPAAIIANRVHPWALQGAFREPTVARRGASVFQAEVRRELVRLTGMERARADTDRLHLARVGRASGLPVILVPELDRDVYDLKALHEVARHLSREGRAA